MNSTVFLQLVLIADMLVVRSLVGGCLVRAGSVVSDLVGTVLRQAVRVIAGVISPLREAYVRRFICG